MLPFVLEIVQVFGAVKTRDVRSNNTHVVTELCYGGFLFKTDIGQSMMGGNSIVVTYSGTIVLWVDNNADENFGVNECRIRAFSDPGDGCHRTLLHMAEEKVETMVIIADAIKKQNEKKTEKEEQELAQVRRKRQLLIDAERLGLSV